MKVLLINGSPHKEGCIYTALGVVAEAIEKEGIDTNIVWIGNKPIVGCTACGHCHKTGSGRCAFGEDGVNAVLDLAEKADGFIFGSAVHYAAATGAITSFLDRLFYAGGKEIFAHKPGAAVLSCRRSGGTAAFEQLNKYFTISQMPVVSSSYWNVVHGHTPDQVRQDLEGMDICRTLGGNMAYMLKCIEAGRAAGILPPQHPPKAVTNFIR